MKALAQSFRHTACYQLIVHDVIVAVKKVDIHLHLITASCFQEPVGTHPRDKAKSDCSKNLLDSRGRPFTKLACPPLLVQRDVVARTVYTSQSASVEEPEDIRWISMESPLSVVSQ
eukprot:1374384-Amphidinium_carterae.2